MTDLCKKNESMIDLSETEWIKMNATRHIYASFCCKWKESSSESAAGTLCSSCPSHTKFTALSPHEQRGEVSCSVQQHQAWWHWWYPRCNFGLLFSQDQPRLISATLSRTEEACSVPVPSKVMELSLLYYNFHTDIYALSWMVKSEVNTEQTGVTLYTNSIGLSKVTAALLR